MNQRIALVILLLAHAAAGRVQAQVATVPVRLGPPEQATTGTYAYSGTSPLDELTKQANSDNWQELQRLALNLVRGMAKQDSLAKWLGDVDRDYYHVIWVGADDSGKDALFRTLVHNGLDPSQATRLPGLGHGAKGRLLDVFLSTDKTSRISSLYVSTQRPSPLAAQLPDVVAKLSLPTMLASLEGTVRQVSAAFTAEPHGPQLHVTVFSVELPYQRADVKIRDVAATPASVEEFKDELAKVQSHILAREARDSECARQLAGMLVSQMGAIASACAGAPGCVKKLGDAVEVATTTAMTSDTCKREAASLHGHDAPLEVEKRFADLAVTLKANVVRAAWDEKNESLTSLSFGLATALVVGGSSLDQARVKVDSGKLAAAPLNRDLSMVTINVHPLPYDAELPRITNGERYRLFGAVVLTPDPGFGGGVAALVVRGLSINAGVAWLISDTLRAGETLGTEPRDPQDPFKRRLNRVGFVGLAYNFK